MKNIFKVMKHTKAKAVISAVMVLCLLCSSVCLSGCLNSNAGGIGSQGQQVTVVQADTSALPDYVAKLVKLDEVFKAYSYSGYDEEAFADMILKYYIAATGDMYAEYMTPEEYEAYFAESAGEFVGVGISIVETIANLNGYNYKVMQVISVFKDSPALEHGIKVGDLIVYAGAGDEKELVNTLGYNEALSRLRGPEGTVAEFTVFRPDDSEVSGYKVIDFAIERKKVTTESVTYRLSETDDKVGIVHISSFDQTTAIQFTDAVDTLLDMGCEYFVFDVRNNPGGALASIEAVLSYFLERNDLIIGIEYGDGSTEADYVSVRNYGPMYEGFNVRSSDIGKYKKLKSVVITNGNTASAAELFTATFRDYGIAEIVGETTYGKGCMQTILPLDEFGLEGGLRVTTAMYFSASREIYHEIGIVPDYEVSLSEEALDYNFYLLPESKDAQLQKAIEILINNND